MADNTLQQFVKLVVEATEAWPQFDTDHDQVSGADLVEWFAEWRVRAKKAVSDALVEG